jgi:hypothetical protein
MQVTFTQTVNELSEAFDLIIALLPFLIPLALISFGLLAFVIVDIIKKKQTKTLSPVLWLLIALLIDVIGPVLYIIFGRSDTAGDYEDF